MMASSGCKGGLSTGMRLMLRFGPLCVLLRCISQFSSRNCSVSFFGAWIDQGKVQAGSKPRILRGICRFGHVEAAQAACQLPCASILIFFLSLRNSLAVGEPSGAIFLN